MASSQPNMEIISEEVCRRIKEWENESIEPIKVSAVLANILISDPVKISLTSDGEIDLHIPLRIRAIDRI
jgi:hypothetical protein